MRTYLILTLWTILATAFSSPAAQSAASREDERIEREKVLRAADQLEVLLPQIENLKSEIEQLKISLQGFNEKIEKIQSENTALKKNIADLEASHTKEREALIDEVSKIIEESSSKKKNALSSSSPSKSSIVSTNQTAVTPPSPSKPKSETGYEHVVSAGETLSAIARAYQAQGVKVSVTDLIKANNLDANGNVKIGQKLFIPKK